MIAPDFADIFHNNCFKNGILPIRLPRAVCDQLMEDAQAWAATRGSRSISSGRWWCGRTARKSAFEIDPFRKHLLLNGLDDIGQTMQHAPQIDAYEQARGRDQQPWLPGITAG